MKALFLAVIGALNCVMLTGCASHAASIAIEAPHEDIRAAFNRVIPEIAAVLNERDFSQDPEARLRENLRSYHPEAITWSKEIRVGFRGGTSVVVWLWHSHRGINITLGADDDGTGEELMATQSALVARLRKQFPNMVTKETSWKYLNMK